MATQVPNRRLLRDNSPGMLQTLAMPAAGANNITTAFDIGAGPWHPEEIEIEIAVPALPALVSTTDSITITLYSAPDNVTFTAASPAVQLVIAGVATTGPAAQTVTIRPHIGIQRYVAFKQVATSGAGNNTGVTVSYQILT